jgi:hypothetical protein
VTELLLSVHVLAAILVIGPITVAASLFPRYVRQGPSSGTAGTAVLLHRTCRGYAVAGVVVPVFGVATGARLGVLTDAWLLASVVLTACAAALLALGVLPGQRRMLAAAERGAAEVPSAAAARLSMLTGVFNLLWATVVVLMIVRPGSTTGA